jgi:hypothetical protein
MCVVSRVCVQSLRMLFNSLMLSLPSIWNIGSLLFVVAYIFAVLGACLQLFVVAYIFAVLGARLQP